MEPHFFNVENDAGFAPNWNYHDAASMEPHFFNVENYGLLLDSGLPWYASMEPHFFNVENKKS